MDLEEPDGDVDCEAQGSGVGGVVGGGEGEEGGAGAGAEFFEDAVNRSISTWDRNARSDRVAYPWMPMT